MSGRAGVRSSSRRNTPQSPPPARIAAPERSTRATRSQSREISDGEMGIQLTRRSTRGNLAEKSAGRGGRKTKQALRDVSKKGLSAVVEELNDADLEQEQDLNAVEARRSLSSMSGTTARTSHSAQELADLRADEMLDALPDLADASDKVLNVVVLHKVAEASQRSVEARIKLLQDPASTARSKLSRLFSGYREQKAVYGNDMYISLSIALRGILGVRLPTEVGDGPWRPDDVFYKANLAKLVNDVLLPGADAKEPFVEKMERDFPAPFLSQLSDGRHTSYPVGVSSLVNETFEAAFSLRVQLFLSMMNLHIQEPGFDPAELLLNIFYLDGGVGELKGWDIDGIRAADLSKRRRQEMVNELESIRTHFNQEGSGEAADIQTLAALYPWSECVMKLLLWAQKRADEIEAHLASLGGAGSLQAALEAELQNRKYRRAKLSEEAGGGTGFITLEYQPSEMSQQPSERIELMKHPTGTKRKASRASLEYSNRVYVKTSRRKVAAARLSNQHEGVQRPPPSDDQASKMVASSVDKRTQTVQSGEPRAPAVKEVTPEGADQPQIDEYEPLVHSDSDVPPEKRRRLIQRVQRASLAEQDKENRPENDPGFASSQKRRFFVDPQPNAQKVSFESQSSTQRRASSSRTKRPRPVAENEDFDDQLSEVSQDAGFQTQEDYRPYLSKTSRTAGTKRAVSTTASGSPPKRVRLTQERDRSVTLDPEIQDAVNQANGHPPLSQIQIYNAAKTQAKLYTAQNVHGRKRVQTRTRWTDEETAKLHDLITSHGVSWSLLKSLDSANVLADRDQVALKDKARNMYIDYLKSGIAIPNNFHNIALKQVDMTKLKINHGIDLLAIRREAEGEESD